MANAGKQGNIGNTHPMGNPSRLSLAEAGRTTYTAGNGIDSTALAGGAITVDLDGTSNGTSGLGLTSGGISISSNIAGLGLALSSGVINLDLNSLTAAVVDVAADSFSFIDASDSNNPKKESIADLMTAVAGRGLVAVSGVLAVTPDPNGYYNENTYWVPTVQY